MLPIIIAASILVFILLVFFISEIGNKDVERLWMFVKYEFIIFTVINVLLWVIISLKMGTFRNISLFVPSAFIIYFIIVLLAWNHYRNTSLRYEKSSFFTSISDGYGRYTPKSGLVGGLSIYAVILPIITLMNILLKSREVFQGF